MARADYPLRLRPHLVEKPWGGTRLGPGVGEAWDLSVHPDGPCTVANGPLAGRTLADVVAESPEDFGGPVRLLAKRLDCADTLSIQVHPQTGDPKTESWVVLDADEGAGVYHGFRRTVNPDQVRRAALDETLDGLMRFVPVARSQCVFVPSGTVHAIGGGLYLFELQQSSNTTYRLYDWGRGRELHLDEGLRCAELSPRPPIVDPQPQPDGTTLLVECEHFRVRLLETHEHFQLDPRKGWIALLLLSGEASADGEPLRPGETLMLPAAAGKRTLNVSSRIDALVYNPGATLS